MEAYKSKFSEALTPAEEGERAASREARLNVRAVNLINEVYKALNKIFDAVETSKDNLYEEYKNNGATDETLSRIEDLDLNISHFHPDMDDQLGDLRGELSEFFDNIEKFREETPNLKMTRIGEKRGK